MTPLAIGFDRGVATDKHGKSSSDFCVERHVRFHKFNYSDIISNRTGDSSARGCSVALSSERGNLRAAAKRRACNPQSRRKAAVNAPERLALDCAIPNLHPGRSRRA
jgi:hypothetical protein